MKVAVVGSRGQLGAAIVQEFESHEVVPLGHEELDVTRDADVAAIMDRVRPTVIINCAADNDVDGAEDHPVDALDTNAFAVRALARAAADLGATLVHFGTDFVFDGTSSVPYTESDPPNPLSAYAMSKLLGEWFAEDARKFYVLRVESLFGRAAGGRPAKGSVAGILKTIQAGDEARVFEDRTITPTYIMDAAWATRRLLENGAPFGIYHCVNSGRTTWLELAREMARQLGIEARLVPISLKDARLKANRPAFCALSNRKLASAGIEMPSWQDAMARYLATVRDDLAHQLSNS